MSITDKWQLEVLNTDRLILRYLSLNDVNDMFEYGADEMVSKHVMWERYSCVEDGKNFAEHVINQYNTENYFWAIELKENKKMIGTINFVAYKKKYNWAELGYVLNQNYWGKGYMTEAIEAVLTYGFQSLKLNKIQAQCIQENIGSYKVMEKSGMTFDGVMREHMIKNGIYVNLVCYSILKSEYNKTFGG